MVNQPANQPLLTNLNMKFTSLFIKRPVLAVVVNVLLLLVGIMALDNLNTRQYPKLQNAVISINTVYVGADANLMRGFVTTPIERAVTAAEGIDYVESSSTPSFSSVQAFLSVDADADKALTQVIEKVNSVRADLPSEAEPPTVSLAVGETIASMYLSFFSDDLDNNQITDYLVRSVIPQLSTIQGVQRAEIIGERKFAMRVWLNPEQMAAKNVAASEVFAALRTNNVLAPIGSTKGPSTAIDLTASTDLHEVEDFKQLIVRASGNSVVRLGEIADVELGAESVETYVTFNGKNAVFTGIYVAPDANLLSTIERVRNALPDIEVQFPSGLQTDIPYDSTRYVEDSIDEVVLTIVEALAIVIIVIFLFLGSVRAVIIPAVAVPLSLLGACAIMLAMGFSINLLTLLAMVLGIGMVVDDAIIILENIHRHIEEGKSPKEAALQGAGELAGPVVAMTITLVAVFAPIGFIGGLTGTLFSEFAFTLAGAVLISGLVALTLSPVMCAVLLKPSSGKGFEAWLERFFERIRVRYQNGLHRSLGYLPVTLVFGLIVLIMCGLLFVTSQQELSPQEDQGFAFLIYNTTPNSTIDQTAEYSDEIVDIAQQYPAADNVFILAGIGGSGLDPSSGFGGVAMQPWKERDQTTQEVLQAPSIIPNPGNPDQPTVLPPLGASLGNITGLQTRIVTPPSLPSPGLFPIELVIGSTTEPEETYPYIGQIIGRALGPESGKFIFLDANLKIDKKRYRLRIDREKAAAIGVNMASLSSDLSAMLAGGFANRFSIEGRSYKVIPQVSREQRFNPEQILEYQIRTTNGNLVKANNFVTLEQEIVPRSLNRFQQLNAVKITGVPRPGVALGDALNDLENIVDDVLPVGYTVDYAGQSRQFKREGSQLVMTFLFALIVIYLVLAAQFESFIDPVIMLVTVPMAICGAMLFVSMGTFTTLNIFTQVGLVTLVGVISKHGILMVEFANELRQQRDLTAREAIIEASGIRLRPILMTTVSLVVAVIPLIMAEGPGAGARFAMGLVIASGMTIGTIFTLFVLPAVYVVISSLRPNKHIKTSY